jgi:hypothetical protein
MRGAALSPPDTRLPFSSRGTNFHFPVRLFRTETSTQNRTEKQNFPVPKTVLQLQYGKPYYLYISGKGAERRTRSMSMLG